MFCKIDVCRKSIVTLALSYDNRKIVVRYFVNRAPEPALKAAGVVEGRGVAKGGAGTPQSNATKNY